MKVCVIAKLSFQKVSESFYTKSFEYHRASIRHFGHLNVLAYARICVHVSMRYRSSETNYQYGYRHKCIYGSLLTANKLGFCLFVF